MLNRQQIDRYADVLLWALKTARKEKFKKGDIVLVRFDRSAINMAEIVQAKLLVLGMNPVMRLEMTPTMQHNFYEKAGKQQLVFLGAWENELCERVNGSIYLYAPDSLTHLKDIDPKRIGTALVARKPLRDILQKREEQGTYGWTLCAFPTAELAKQAGMSLRQYANQVIRACYLDQADPVRAWKRIFKEAATIKKWMNRMKVNHYHIESENVDLRIRPGEKRRWIGISGHNIPSFEIFTSPDWRGTEGRYYANQPSFRSGNYVKGVRLTFEKGAVVEVQAEKGKGFVAKQLEMDRGASRVGEFSLTDKRFSRINRFMANTLYDENYGGRYGNCHLALGSSYSDTFDGDPAGLSKDMKRKLGFNDSALHWDLVNTEKKTVTAHLKSGKKVLIYADGMFRYG